MRIVAIIQARMGSTRLPGKVLKDICGKPLLWHLVSRVRRAEHVDDVIIAATVSEKDDELERFAADNSLGVYRGSVDDIVDRYLNAGRMHGASIVVRVWGDCPLIDPALIDRLLSLYVQDNCNYANNFNPPTYPLGMNLEVYSLEVLERIRNETNDAFYREYPFEYIYANSGAFKTAYDRNDTDLSNIHLTVDYQEDLELVREIFRDLYDEEKAFSLKEILELLENHPELRKANLGLARNIEFNKDKELRGGNR